ncbi:hypothetical protein BC829DRAFT_384711 [Chytridium lagenaria]|nr:hypothetical protein BC829DRAFT_384711 [Chytridium lagenaria]
MRTFLFLWLQLCPPVSRRLLWVAAHMADLRYLAPRSLSLLGYARSSFFLTDYFPFSLLLPLMRCSQKFQGMAHVLRHLPLFQARPWLLRVASHLVNRCYRAQRSSLLRKSVSFHFSSSDYFIDI